MTKILILKNFLEPINKHFNLFNIWKTFYKKSDNFTIEERTNILKNKMYKNNDNNLFLSSSEDIDSYVRFQYLLG